MLLVGLEPEDESPIVFLRLRKARPQARHRGSCSVAPFASRGLRKLGGTLIRDRARRRGRRARRRSPHDGDVGARRRRRDPGRRAAGRPSPGALTAAAALAAHDRRPARLGAAPGRRPRRARGRLPAQPAARRPPGRRRRGPRRRRPPPGASTRLPDDRRAATPTAILAAAARRRARRRWSSAASTPTTCPTRPPRRAALEAAPFVVSLELRAHRGHRARRRGVPGRRRSPRRPAPSSTGRAAPRPFDEVLRGTDALPDLRVLHGSPRSMGVDLGLPDVAAAARRDRRARPLGRRPRRRFEPVAGAARRRAGAGEAVLATWKLLLDDGRLQDGEPLPRRHRARRRSPGSPPATAARARRRRRRRR